MAGCCQTTSQYLDQCWPRSPTPGITNQRKVTNTYHKAVTRLRTTTLRLPTIYSELLTCVWHGDYHHDLPRAYYMTACLCVLPWWRHQMEKISALLAICAGNSPVTGEFPAQRPVTRSFDVFFNLRLNKRLSKQSRGWWFETLSCPLWRHCYDLDA